MTRDQVDSVQGDIAYLKQLATEGRDAPVLVGPVLVAASIIFGIPSLFQWGVVTGLLTVNPWAILAVWVFAGLVFAGVLTMIIRKIDMQQGSETIRNRTIGAAWSACGYSIFVGWLALMAYGFSTGSWAPMSLMPTLVMIAYGSAWMIAGLIVERRPAVLCGGCGSCVVCQHPSRVWCLYLAVVGRGPVAGTVSDASKPGPVGARLRCRARKTRLSTFTRSTRSSTGASA